MDIHLLDAEPTQRERDALDAFLGPPMSRWVGADRVDDGHSAHGGHSVRAERQKLLPALQHLQQRIGFVSPGALNHLSRRLTVPPADVYGVASFYAMLSLEPQPPRVVHVCDDLVCRLAGSDALIDALQRQVGEEGADVGSACWLASPCLGQCDAAPAALLIDSGENPLELELTDVGVEDLLSLMGGGAAPERRPPWSATAGARQKRTDRDEAGQDGGSDRRQGRGDRPDGGGAPQAGQDGLRLLARVGVVDPESLDDYRAHGGYEALRRAFSLGPSGVIREVLDSKLLGRGGAAFPMGRKWETVARQPRRPHYLICNADESEPGTFKDRLIIESDPFAVIEAMTIAAYATGCERGWIYLRGEYPLAFRRLGRAIEHASQRGFLGSDILGAGFNFEIELRRGAGAYICGEETAIFGSIEGFRGEPRNKPPFPVERGLFGKPTVVNNVETLVNVQSIILEGGTAFAAIGTESSTGTKLFCLAGAVERPGVYEVPFGTSLRQLLDLAGGVRAGTGLRAVLLGGAAGSFITADQLDLPLTFEDVRAAGATLGSGVVIALDDSAEIPELLALIAAFFRDESCGQCVPCRVGTVRQEEALARLRAGRPRGTVEDELALIAEIGEAMRDASICGLGQTASAAIESAIDRLGVFKGGG